MNFNKLFNSNKSVRPLLTILGLLLVAELPFFKSGSHMLSRVRSSLQNDENFRDGIRFLASNESCAKIEKLVKPYSIREIIQSADKLLKELPFPIPTKGQIIATIAKLISDSEVKGKPDFKHFFDSVEEDIKALENAHPKMKKVASKMLGGRDLYSIVGIVKKKFIMNRITESYKAPDTSEVLDLFESVNFDLRRLIKLLILYTLDTQLKD